MVLVALFGSCMFYLEANRHDGNLHSIPDALYWAIGTITTVGFGDKPGTPLGKVLSAGVSLMGVLFLAVPSGIVGSGFAEMMEQDRKTRRVASVLLRSKEDREARAALGGQPNGTTDGQGHRGSGGRDADDFEGSADNTPLSSPTPADRPPRALSFSVAGVDADWARRIEERQAGLEVSLERVEAMLGVITGQLELGGASLQQQPSLRQQLGAAAREAAAGDASSIVDASVEAPPTVGRE